MAKSRIYVLLLALVVSACGTSEKKIPKIPKGLKIEKPQELLDNAHSGSAKGQNLLFLRKLENHHNQSQVYLQSKALLKKITFNRSDNFSPIFISGTQILYVSGVDEMKEYPQEIFINKNKINWPFQKFEKMIYSEIYLKNYKTYYQKRLTKHGGLDFHPSVNGKATAFVYVSQLSDGTFELKNYNFKRGSAVAVINSKNMLMFPNHSSKDQLIWVEYNQSENRSVVKRLLVKNKKQKTKNTSENIFSLKGKIHSLKWSKSEEYILFSSNYKNPENFELYFYSVKGNCHIQQTYTLENEIEPDFYVGNTDQLIFTRFDNSGKTKLFTLKANYSLPCQLTK